MSRRYIRIEALAALFLWTLGSASCSESEEPPSGSEASVPDGSAPVDTTADARPDGMSDPVDPFMGDCSAAKWATVTDECWSCLCEGCAATLNLCEEGCIELMQCALAEYTLVGDAAEIQCESDATRDLCLPAGAETTWTQAVNFDVCLISTPKPAGQFRICEAECNIAYSGDVCERYPGAAADGG